MHRALALEHAALLPVPAGAHLGRSVQPVPSLRALPAGVCVGGTGKRDQDLQVALAAWAAQLLRSEDAARALRIPSPCGEVASSDVASARPPLTLPVPRPVAVACGLVRPLPLAPLPPEGVSRNVRSEAAVAALTRRVELSVAGGAAALCVAAAPLFEPDDGAEPAGAEPTAWLEEARAAHDAVSTSQGVLAATLLSIVASGAEALALPDRCIGEATAAALLASPLDARKALAGSIVLSGEGVASLSGMGERLIADIRLATQRGGRGAFKPISPLSPLLAVINTVAPHAVAWVGGSALAVALAKRHVSSAARNGGAGAMSSRLAPRRERDATNALIALGAAGVWPRGDTTALSADAPRLSLIDPDCVARPSLQQQQQQQLKQPAAASAASIPLDADILPIEAVSGRGGAPLQPLPPPLPEQPSAISGDTQLATATKASGTAGKTASSGMPSRLTTAPEASFESRAAGLPRGDDAPVGGAGRGAASAATAPSAGGTTREQWQSIGTRSKTKGTSGAGKKAAAAGPAGSTKR